MPEINQPIVNQSPEDTSSPFSNDQGFTFRNDPIDPNQKPLSEMSPEELQDMQTRYQNLAGNNKPFEQGIESAPGDENNYAINNYGNEGWLESWKKSWFSGIGDIETSFAGTFKALGYDDIADEWYKSGMNRVERNKNFVSKDLGEFSADDLLNPYYYSKIIGRSLPSNVALTGTAVAAGVLTGGIGTAATAIGAAAARQAAVNIVIDQLSGGSTKGLIVPTKGKLLQSIIAGTVATLTEAGMEGGSLFKEMIEQGVDEKTAKDAFNKTVAANMLLGVTNLAQFAQFFNPVAKGIMKGGVVSETIEAFQKRFLNSNGKQLLANTVTEGLEEVYQGAIQAKAKEGGDWGDFITGLPSAMANRLTTSEGWGEMAAGAVFGGAMGAVPAAYRSITGKSLAYKEAVDKLSDARIAVEDGDWVKSTRPFVAKMFELFENEIGSNQTVGVKVGDAIVPGLHQITPEKIKIMANAIPGIIDNPAIAAEVKSQMTELVDKAREGFDQVSQIVQIKSLDRNTQYKLFESIFQQHLIDKRIEKAQSMNLKDDIKEYLITSLQREKIGIAAIQKSIVTQQTPLSGQSFQGSDAPLNPLTPEEKSYHDLLEKRAKGQKTLDPALQKMGVNKEVSTPGLNQNEKQAFQYLNSRLQAHGFTDAQGNVTKSANPINEAQQEQRIKEILGNDQVLLDEAKATAGTTNVTGAPVSPASTGGNPYNITQIPTEPTDTESDKLDSVMAQSTLLSGMSNVSSTRNFAANSLKNSLKREYERLQQAAKEGKYSPMVPHQGVPFEDFLKSVNAKKETNQELTPIEKKFTEVNSTVQAATQTKTHATRTVYTPKTKENKPTEPVKVIDKTERIRTSISNLMGKTGKSVEEVLKQSRKKIRQRLKVTDEEITEAVKEPITPTEQTKANKDFSKVKTAIAQAFAKIGIVDKNTILATKLVDGKEVPIYAADDFGYMIQSLMPKIVANINKVVSSINSRINNLPVEEAFDTIEASLTSLKEILINSIGENVTSEQYDLIEQVVENIKPVILYNETDNSYQVVNPLYEAARELAKEEQLARAKQGNGKTFEQQFSEYLNQMESVQNDESIQGLFSIVDGEMQDEEMQESQTDEVGKAAWEGKDRIDAAVTTSTQFALAVSARLKKIRQEAKILDADSIYDNDTSNIYKIIQSLLFNSSNPYDLAAKIDLILKEGTTGGNPISAVDEQIFRAIRDTFYELHSIVTKNESDNGIPNVAKISSFFNTLRSSYTNHVSTKISVNVQVDGSVTEKKLNRDKQFFAILNAITSAVQQVYNTSENRDSLVNATKKVKDMVKNKTNRTDLINAVEEMLSAFSNDKLLDEVFESSAIIAYLERFKNPSMLNNAVESIVEIFSEVKTNEKDKVVMFNKFKNTLVAQYLQRKSLIYGQTSELQYYDSKIKKMLSAIEGNVKAIHDLKRLQAAAEAFAETVTEAAIDKNVELVSEELKKGDLKGTANVSVNERGITSFSVTVNIAGKDITIPLAGLKQENEKILQAWNKEKAKNPTNSVTLKLNQTVETFNNIEYPFSIEVYSNETMVGKTRVRNFTATQKNKSYLQSLTDAEHGSLSVYNKPSFLLNPLIAIRDIIMQMLPSNIATLVNRKGERGKRYEDFKKDDVLKTSFGMFQNNDGVTYTHLHGDINGKSTSYAFNLPVITIDENGKYQYTIGSDKIGSIDSEDGMFMQLVKMNYDILKANGVKNIESFFPSFVKFVNDVPVFNEAELNSRAKQIIDNFIDANISNLISINSNNVHEIAAISQIKKALSQTNNGKLNFSKAEQLLQTLNVSDRFVKAMTRAIENLKLNETNNFEQNAKDFIVSYEANEFFLKHFTIGNPSGFDKAHQLRWRSTLFMGKGTPVMSNDKFNTVIADKGFIEDLEVLIDGKDTGLKTDIFNGQTYYRGDFADQLSYEYGSGNGYASLFKTIITSRDNNGNAIGIKSASEALTYDNTINDPVKRAIYEYMLENNVHVFTFSENEKTNNAARSSLKIENGKIVGNPNIVESYMSDIRIQTVLDNKNKKVKISKQAVTMIGNIQSAVTEQAKQTIDENFGTAVEVQSTLELLDNKLILEAFENVTTGTVDQRNKVIEYLKKKIPNMTKSQLGRFAAIIDNISSIYTSENDADKFGELIASSFRKSSDITTSGIIATFVSNPEDSRVSYMQQGTHDLIPGTVVLPGNMRKLFPAQDNAKVFITRSPFNNPSMGMFANVVFDDSYEENKIILPHEYVTLQNADFDGDQASITILNEEAEAELKDLYAKYRIPPKAGIGALAIMHSNGSLTETQYREILQKIHEVSVNKLNSSLSEIYNQNEVWSIIKAGLDLENGFIAALEELGMNKESTLSIYNPHDLAEIKERVGAGQGSIGIFALCQRVGAIMSQMGITSNDPIYTLAYNGQTSSGSDISKTVDAEGNGFAKLSGEVVQTGTDTLKHDYHFKAGLNNNNYLWYFNFITRFNFGLSNKQSHNIAIQTVNQPIAKLLYQLQEINSKSSKSREFSTVYDNMGTAIQFLKNIISQYGLSQTLDDLVTNVNYETGSTTANLEKYVNKNIDKLQFDKQQAIELFTNPSFANKQEAEDFVTSQTEALKVLIQLDHISQPINSLISSYKVIEDIDKEYNQSYVKIQKLMSLGLLPNVLGIDGFANIRPAFKMAPVQKITPQAKARFEDIEAAYNHLQGRGPETITIREHRAMGMTTEMMNNYFSLLYRYENGRVIRDSSGTVVEFQPLLYDNPALNAQLKNLFRSMATMQSISPVYSQSFRDYVNETIKRLHNTWDIRFRPNEINDTIEKFVQHVFEESTKETIIKEMYQPVPGLDSLDMDIIHEFALASDLRKNTLVPKLQEIAKKSPEAKALVDEVEFMFNGDSFNYTFSSFLENAARYRIKMNNDFVNGLEFITSEYSQAPIGKVNNTDIFSESKYYYDNGVLIATSHESLKDTLEKFFAPLRSLYPDATTDREFYESVAATPNASYNVSGISKESLIEFAHLLAAQEELNESGTNVELTYNPSQNVIYDTHTGKVFTFTGEVEQSRVSRVFTDVAFGGAINSAYMYFKNEGSELTTEGVKKTLSQMFMREHQVTPRYKPIPNIRSTVSSNGDTYSFSASAYSQIASGLDSLKQDLESNGVLEEGHEETDTVVSKIQDFKRAYILYELLNRNWNTFKPYLKMLEDLEQSITTKNIEYVKELKEGTTGNSSDIIAKLVRKNPEITRYVPWYKVNNNAFDVGDGLVSYFHTVDENGTTWLMANLVTFNTENTNLNERGNQSMRISVPVMKINTDGETYRLDQATPVDRSASDLVNYAIMGNVPSDLITSIQYEVTPAEIIRAINRILTGKASYTTTSGKELGTFTINFSDQVDNDNPKTREIKSLAAKAFKAGKDKELNPNQQVEAYMQLFYKLHEMATNDDQFVKITPEQAEIVGSLYRAMVGLQAGVTAYTNSVNKAINESDSLIAGEGTNQRALMDFKMERKDIRRVNSTNVNIGHTGTAISKLHQWLMQKIWGGGTKVRRSVRDFSSKYFRNITDVKNLNDLLGLFANQINKDGSLTALAQHLQTRLGATKVSMLDASQFDQLAKQHNFNVADVPMYYDPNTKELVINADFAYRSDDAGAEIGKYIIHEALHRLTVDAIDNDPAFRNEVETVYKQFLANINSTNLPTALQMRLGEIINAINSASGTADKLKEFISYAFTEEAMRTAMSKMSETGTVSQGQGKSMWTKFIDIVMNMLGIKTKNLMEEFSGLMNAYDNSFATDKLSSSQIVYKNGRSISSFIENLTSFFDEHRISGLVASASGKTQQAIINDWDAKKNLGIEKQNALMDLMRVQKGVFRDIQTARINYLNAQRGKKFSDGTYVYQVLGQFNNDILSSVGVPLVDKEVQDNAFEVVGKTNMEYYDNQGALHIRDFTFANNTGTQSTGTSSALGIASTNALNAYLKLAAYAYIREVQGEKIGSIAVMRMTNMGRWEEEVVDYQTLKAVVKRELEIKAMNSQVSSQWTAYSDLLSGNAEFYDESILKQFAQQLKRGGESFGKIIPFDRFMQLINIPMDAPKGRDMQIAKNMYETATLYYDEFISLAKTGRLQDLTFDQVEKFYQMLAPFKEAFPDAGAFDALSALIHREYFNRKMEQEVEALMAKDDMGRLTTKFGQSIVDVSEDFEALRNVAAAAEKDLNAAVSDYKTWSDKYKKLADAVAIEKCGGKLKMYVNRFFGFGKGLGWCFKELIDEDNLTKIMFLHSRQDINAKRASGKISDTEYELYNHMMQFYEKHQPTLLNSRKAEYGYTREQTLMSEGKMPIPFYESTMSQYLVEKGLTREFLTFKKKAQGPDGVNVKYIHPVSGASTMTSLREARSVFAAAVRSNAITQASSQSTLNTLVAKAERLLASGKHEDGQQINFAKSAVQAAISDGEIGLPKFEPVNGRSRTHNLIGVFDSYASSLAFKSAMDKHVTGYQVAMKLADMAGNKPHLYKYMKDIYKNKFMRSNVQDSAEKTLNVMNYIASLSILGGNYIAGIGNIAIGKSNTITELGFKNWAKAEGRILTHRKRALAICSKFNLGQDLDDTITSIGQSNLRKLFNDGMFISHIVGEHWIKNAHSLALLPDAVWNSYDDEGNFIGGTELTPELMTSIKHQVEQVQGKYDFFSKRLHNHNALMATIMKFKGFMLDQIAWKFGKEMKRIDGSVKDEGYWRVAVGALGIPIYNFFAQYGAIESKDPYTKAEMLKAAPKVLREVATVSLLIMAGGMLMGGGDDDKKKKFQANMMDSMTVLGSPDKFASTLKMGLPALYMSGDIIKTAWHGITRTRYQADGKYGQEGDLKFWTDLAQILPARTLTRSLIINEDFGSKKKKKSKTKQIN